MLVLGTMIAFDYSILLRFAWSVIVFILSFDQQLLLAAISAINEALLKLISVLF